MRLEETFEMANVLVSLSQNNAESFAGQCYLAAAQRNK
jgi:hypothetical protein